MQDEGNNDSLETWLIFWSMMMISNYVLTRLNGLVYTLVLITGVDIKWNSESVVQVNI